MLLTRSPLIHPRRGFTARLACVKHAASVRPEPGSNSPLMSVGSAPEGAFTDYGKRSTTGNQRSTVQIWRIADVTVVCLHQRNPPCGAHEPKARRRPRGRGIGIDFWHAVEFSRSGRAPKYCLFGRFRGNPSTLALRGYPVKSVPELTRMPEAPFRGGRARRPSAADSSFMGAARGPATNRCPLLPCERRYRTLGSTICRVKSRDRCVLTSGDA